MNQGLVTEERNNIDNDIKPFARKTKEIRRRGLNEGASLLEVVRFNFYIHRQTHAHTRFCSICMHGLLISYCILYNNQVQEIKPDVILGLSSVGGLFSKEVYNLIVDE